MKLRYLIIILSIPFVACDSGGKTDMYKNDSSGNINSLQVVMDNKLWNGPVGEEIRSQFAAPTDGLPQEEPLFTINQIPPFTFTDFARAHRNFLYVALAESDTVAIRKNPYAKPQIGAFVKAVSEEDLKEAIYANSARIIAAFRNNELKEKQKRTRISLLRNDTLENMLGVAVQVPSAYRVASANKNFVWLRKNLENGTANIIMYQAPLHAIGNDSTIVADIVKVRDSIGGGHLPVEGDGRFITEAAYAPYLFNAQIDGKFAYETKGTWEIKGAFMAGPFVNYAVRDEENGRWVILEGFTYAPAEKKRNHQFELESILRTARFK